MRLNRFYMPTLRELPAEAETKSHQLLLRAAMIRRAASGIYSYLPLGYRVVRKIENIVRDTMDEFGAQEILMSAVQPRELWDQSGRWDVYGPEMFKLKDRHDREFCLGPTAEEYFTDLVKGEITSYKQLPLNLYQIQTKYRDEKRPRFGINRAREFSMKDAYTFDKDEAGMQAGYENMRDAYHAVFTRLGMDYKVVRGDSGAMGGDMSEEFIALSEVGEGVITHCASCSFAATDEKAEVALQLSSLPAASEPVEVHTPGATTIADVSAFLNKPASHCAKAIDLLVSGEPVFLFIPGDRELNMTKTAAYLKTPEHDIEMMDADTVRRLTGSEPGYTGPVGLEEGVRIIVDRSLVDAGALVVGANRTEYHKTDVVYGRDFEAEIADDLLMIETGDACPECGGKLQFDRGIEVGNIFQFGTKYSEPMGATFLDENGKAVPFQMGSYGIGITRSVTAVVEQNWDEAGIVWPMVVAPYHVIVTIANMKDETAVQKAEELYERLLKERVEVVLDDRNERAGVKFNDRDLIGYPIRITVGKRAAEEIVEYSLRKDRINEDIPIAEAVERVLEATRDYR